MARAKRWDFSCPDWAERLAAGRSIIPELPLDVKAATKAVRVFDTLRLPDVPGNPRNRDACADWQREIVAATFGSVDKSGYRMVKMPFVLVPKKNNKTTGAAAFMLTGLLIDSDPMQAYQLFGPTQKIADRAFTQARGMIEVDPELVKRFHIAAHTKTITDRLTDSTLKVQTFDEKIATGEIVKGALVDEVHLLGKVHYAERVMAQLTGGMISRPDAFLMMITTQSDQPPAGLFKANLQLARDIRDGRVTGPAASLLPVLYEFPESVQTAPPDKDGKRAWENKDIWWQVLPNLGRSVNLKALEATFETEKQKGEAAIRVWASQHLNIEIGLGLHSQRWRGADHWEAAIDPTLTLDELLDRCEVVCAGIDGGGLDDLFGLAIVGIERDTRRWLSWCRAWGHESVIERRKDIAPALSDFIDDGDMSLTEGDQDIEDIAALLAGIRERGLFPAERGVGMDPAAIGGLFDALKESGFEEPELAAVPQGFRLSSAVWGIERKLADGTMRVADQRMMAWCVGNAKAEQAGNAVYISKAVAGRAKIDPLIALFNAVKLIERAPVARGTDNGGFDKWMERLGSTA